MEKKIDITSFFNCSTKGVIYVAECPCSLLYVGKTIRQLRCRVLELINDVELKKGQTNRETYVKKSIMGKLMACAFGWSSRSNWVREKETWIRDY